MNRFRDWLNSSLTKDDIRIPNENYGIPRSEMPQIDDPEDFLKYLDSCGVVYGRVPVTVQNLKMTQKDFDLEKVVEIIKSMTFDFYKWENVKPMIISSDRYVLDGHHRALAMLNMFASRDTTPTYTVDLPMPKLLRYAQDYGKSYKKQITE